MFPGLGAFDRLGSGLGFGLGALSEGVSFRILEIPSHLL